MKLKAQSLIEFAVILMCVTAVAIISLQIISNKINTDALSEEVNIETTAPESISSEETNCTNMGLYWDRQNGICEAK